MNYVLKDIGQTELIKKFLLRENNNLSCTYFDLPVDDEKFKDMEIVLSSLLNQNEKNKVKKMIVKYNPTANIMKSRIQLRK